ncbi:hypothetical protein [Leptospira interrogans]|uniref:hypothetical protein n=1 Tax=Leptospira interrogans TaxID=173 RepID=UPI00077303E0|nr:hypothetical protein [Leptospira interrogans]
MEVNVFGRLKNLNLPTAKSLLPIIEAIVNSIQATDKGKKNKISLIINHEAIHNIIDEDADSLGELTSFIVEDEGSGFNEENYKSFCTSDSIFKEDLGGKGIGRFLWLKVFDEVQVESIFSDSGKYFRRKFLFSAKKNGVSNHDLVEIQKQRIFTQVKLFGLNTRYRRFIPKSKAMIAQRILEHILPFYLSDETPNIMIGDSESKFSLNDIFEHEYEKKIEKKEFKINETDFTIHFVKFYSTRDVNHKLSLCAHFREVRKINLNEKFPILTTRIAEGEKEYNLFAYVSSEYLDSTVNTERTAFNIEEDIVEGLFESDISFNQIVKEATKYITEYLSPIIQPLREANLQRVEKFIKEKSPDFRHIISYSKEELQDISPALSGERLELEIFKISQKVERKIKEKAVVVLDKVKTSPENISDYISEMEDALEEVSEMSRSKLAKYILYRKTILDLFEKTLHARSDGKYELESIVHNMIYPVRTTSDEVMNSKQNLWLIDEKLCYHYLLASDKSLATVDSNGKKSLSRPDLIVYNNPYAFAEDTSPHSSIVIIEFKRPMRDDYDSEDNPISQVYDYIREIRNGNKTDIHGRPFPVNENTPFYSYIISDITKSLIKQAENSHFTQTPDSQGYFGFNQNLKCYTEIISFDKLLDDARKRNKFLFEKLGLPTQSTNHI